MKRSTTQRSLLDIAIWTVGVAALAILIAEAAASDHRMTSPTNDRWRSECGSCHVPYPPRFLPAQSWRAIMDRLDRHFGSDATVDAAARSEIAAFLDRNAGHDRRGSNAASPLRITETGWFVREHAEVISAVSVHSGVNASDCAACHRQANEGSFSERTLRLPRSR